MPPSAISQAGGNAVGKTVGKQRKKPAQKTARRIMRKGGCWWRIMKTPCPVIQPRPAILPVTVICLLLFASACSEPADPRTTPITAATPEEFTAWKNMSAQKIPAAEMEEFDLCVNEIRMGIMQRKEASGVGPIAAKLCEYINGKNMREVIVMGHTATIGWVTRELALQRTNIERTEEGLKKPGSESSKDGLRDYLTIAKDNVAKLEARLEKAKTRLAELQAKS
jgi:hypothetical protein